jgi:hypothetical protein
MCENTNSKILNRVIANILTKAFDSLYVRWTQKEEAVYTMVDMNDFLT